MKNVTIFGATGGVGNTLTKQALNQGLQVTAFVRDRNKMNFAHKNLKVFEGDVLNLKQVEDAIQGQDAIFCTLGEPRNNKNMVRAKGTQNIILAMNKLGVKRLISLSALGAGNSFEQCPFIYKHIIFPLFLKNVFKDHNLQEQYILQSNLDWTIIRAANLTNGNKEISYKHGETISGSLKLKISRKDVAHFMLSELCEPTYVHRTPYISD